jgi:hypothetical protein
MASSPPPRPCDCVLSCASRAECDKWLGRSKFFAYCFRPSPSRGRKSFGSQRLHFVAAAGVPIFGDIIHSFCRFRLAESPCFPVRAAFASRQNEASFCRIWFHLIRVSGRRSHAKAQSERWLLANGKSYPLRFNCQRSPHRGKLSTEDFQTGASRGEPGARSGEQGMRNALDSLLPAPCSLLLAPCSLLPAPCSELPAHPHTPTGCRGTCSFLPDSGQM